MSDDTTTYPHLGFNPVPGVPGDVASMGDKIGKAVGSLTEANGLITKLKNANDAVWQGDAGNAFRSHLNDKLVTDMSHAQESLETAVHVLSGWHTDLSNFKDVASRLDQAAAAAQQQYEQAKNELEQAKSNPDLGLAGKQFPDAQSLQQAQNLLNEAESAVNTAASKVGDAGNTLESIMKQAKDLASQHDDVASKAANALKQATSKLAPHKPGMFSSMFSSIGNALKAVGGWVKDHLDAIHSVLSTIAAIGGLVALVTPPPIDAIALGVSVVAGAGALACDAANPQFRAGIDQLVHGHFNKQSLGAAMTGVTDLLSVVPGVGVASKAIKGADVVGEGVSGIGKISDIASTMVGKPGFAAKMIAKIPGVDTAVNALKLPAVANTVLTHAGDDVSGAINLGMKAKSAVTDVYKDAKKALS
ncbi:MAG TPA: hypothetical protein VFW65_12140 [Pseudonocardiaceae bacterium]|nr:hypothetical protein [Pseudonocardiaceae bacterium]